MAVKRSEREADHSPPSSAAVKYAWSYTAFPPYVFMGVVLNQAQGQLYVLHSNKFKNNVDCNGIYMSYYEPVLFVVV
jgi:hypothetical protein